MIDSDIEKFAHLQALLIEAREAMPLTSEELANKLGRDVAYVAEIEQGERQLGVIEFLALCQALEIEPERIVKELAEGKKADLQKADNILQLWDITPTELTLLVKQNPSLRGMLMGYVAELKFQQMWLEHPLVTSFYKHDDHNRRGKGDRVVVYKGESFIVEVKSLQTKTIKKQDGIWVGKSQVDASDRRQVTFPDGSTLNTTLLLAGEFDLLAVNIFAFEEKWRFVFAKNSDLPRSTYGKYTPAQRQQLLKSLVDVTWPPQPPFVADPFVLLSDLYEERTKSASAEVSFPQES